MSALRLIPLALATCMGGAAAAQELATLDGFADFGIPEKVKYDRPMDVVSEVLTTFPETLNEGRPQLSVEAVGVGERQLQIDVTETGQLDDAVAGTQSRYILRETEAGQFQLTSYGRRYKCRRLGNSNWVTTACP